MDERQAYALRRPVQDPALVLDDVGLWDAQRLPGGNVLRSVLAVDR